jgi:glycosyltransferase involved in cell wall biosynthesis
VNPYKILIITDAWYPQTNGVVRTMDNLGQQLQKRGHQVKYITPNEFITVPMPTYPEIRLALNAWPKINKMIKAYNPQVVHISTEGPLGFFGRKYCHKNNIKFTTSYHTKFPDYVYARTKIPVNFSYRFMRFFHKHSQSILVTTQTMKKELAENGFDENKLKVWTRGVEHDVFGNGTKVKDFKGPVWIYVGRVAIEKNIKAFLDLDVEGTKIIVGDGPQMNEVKKKYPHVVFTGMLGDKDIANYLASSDVFVFPSKTDTFGIVLIEALAAGLPIAGYKVPGPIDITGGTEIDSLDDDLKTSALKSLKIDKSKCKELAQKYTWEECAKIFEENCFSNY